MSRFNIRRDAVSPSIRHFSHLININADLTANENWVMTDFDTFVSRDVAVAFLMNAIKTNGLAATNLIRGKRIIDNLKTVVRFHGVGPLPLLTSDSDADDTYADAVRIATREFPADTLKLPGSSTCFNATMVDDALASDIVAELATGKTVADLPVVTVSDLKPRLRAAVQRYGCNHLADWKTGLDDTQITDIGKLARAAGVACIPLLFETTTPMVADVETVADDTAIVADGDDTPFDIDSAKIGDLKTYLDAHGVEYPKRAKRVELAALAAGVK